ncbi:MraY family glycosyltransferase [Winkia neuii]|uniref:MraY family glycosyltransferase n=1 Tax=Winkia neuii TaxID=33007 RepID=UPI0023A946D2|nr:MraY family glycosyltransferase [Winkia neuii]WEB57591.1 MraY family glycosyltransferase [Winkia neuii]
MKLYLLLALIAGSVTYLLTPVVRQLALAAHALTPVRKRDVHTVPTPRLGGVAMLGGFAVAMVLASRTSYFSRLFADPQPWSLLAGAVGICLLGFLDDLWDLEWWTKLAGQILIAGGMAWGGVQLVSFPIFGLTIGSSKLSIAVTVLVVVACINAVNFVDGLDGLAAGCTAIGAMGFFVYSYMLVRLTNAQSYASLAAAVVIMLVGICAGFLPHNFHPATIFMGDTGAMLLGLLSAGVSILVTGQVDPAMFAGSEMFPSLLPILLPIAVLILPLTDMTMAVVRRMRAGHSPFHPDRMHLHHRLLNLGYSVVTAVLIMYLWAAYVALGAAALVVFEPIHVGIGLAIGLVVVVVITVLSVPSVHQSIFRKRQRH